MHDASVVAWELRLPIPYRRGWGEPKEGESRWSLHRVRRTNEENLGEPVFNWWVLQGWDLVLAGKAYSWWLLITVWHVEPGGRDSGEVCKHYRRYQNEDGEWHTKWTNGWKWHVHHWHVQIPVLQKWRRALVQRCAYCGGRSTKAAPVNVWHSWDGPRAKHWWLSDPGVYHHGCSGHVARAHKQAAEEREKKG